MTDVGGVIAAYSRFAEASDGARSAVQRELSADLDLANAKRDTALAGADRRRDDARTSARAVVELASRLTATADYLHAMSLSLDGLAGPGSLLSVWANEMPDLDHTAAQAIGACRVGQLAESLMPREFAGTFLADLPALPAVVSLAGGHFVVESAVPAGGTELLRSVLLRLVLGNPAGDVRLTLVDPHGSGQGLAAFLELPPAIRGDKVWVGPEEVEAQLRALSATVESVLQTRLGARYATLDEYNTANPAVAEPHRLVAILDLPAGGWTERSLELLGRLARNGPRAGVHILASLDRSAPVPRGVGLDALLVPATVVRIDAEGTGRIDDPELGEWSFLPDTLPDPVKVETWLADVGRAFAGRSRALSTERVLVPLDWTGSSASGLEVPIGLDEEGDLLSLALGDDPAHGLVGGMTGMGKSNLLHVLITGLASRYSPDELELDLLDFKEGVGFAPYRILPHARAVALETEREFALSVLRDLQDEIARRGRLFSAAGTDQFTAYRASGRALSRIVLLIDEFQILLAGDDPLARDAAAAIEDLVKRGRGFGIHVLLSSQSPSVAGPYLSRIYNQMGLRVALRCRQADALAILGEGNDAAARLEEPGEAIVNEELGQAARNRKVRVALLGRDELTARVAAIAARDERTHPGPITFEGAAPARLEANPRLRELAAGTWHTDPGTAEAFLGEPVEIKAPTAARFERYPRANLLVAGPDEAAAYGLLVAATVSLALEQPEATFDVLDFARPSSSVAGVLADLAGRLPTRLSLAGPREAGMTLAGLLEDLQARLDHSATAEPARYFVIAGVHRWRELRGATQFDSSPEGTSLLRLLDEGPDAGLHVIAWTDGQVSLDRALKRGAVAHFDLRAVLRVPETDAQNLLESTAAARLADNRALFRHEEWPAGQVEKFKPYPVPTVEAFAALLGRTD